MTYYIKYAPTSLDNAVLSVQLKTRLIGMTKNGQVLNMLFYGRPGNGKSSVAKLVSDNTDVIRCDGIDSSDSVLKRIWKVASSINLYDQENRRVVVLDEIDRLSNAAQEKLRAIIDECGHMTSFIGTTNDISAVIPAIKSRMTPINFDVDKGNLTMRSQWEIHLRNVFKMESQSEPDDETIKLSLNYFPDGRQMITHLFV